MLIKKIGILYHPMVPATQTKARELADFLDSKGAQVWVQSAWDTAAAISGLDGTDLILTTGGDGTILRAAQVALPSEIPITGINMGTLGFMTELQAAEAFDRLPDLLAGQGWIDDRAMLETIWESDERDGHPSEIYYALNDVVLARGETPRLIQIIASVDNKPLATYRADGIIAASATGSTGYSLAAGGPVLYPRLKDLILTPIVPHPGPGHSVVLPAESEVKLQLVSFNPAALSVDGHINITVSKDAVVTLRLSSRKTRFLRLHPPEHFFEVLDDKIRGRK